eukprot:403340776
MSSRQQSLYQDLINRDTSIKENQEFQQQLKSLDVIFESIFDKIYICDKKVEETQMQKLPPLRFNNQGSSLAQIGGDIFYEEIKEDEQQYNDIENDIPDNLLKVSNIQVQGFSDNQQHDQDYFDYQNFLRRRNQAEEDAKIIDFDLDDNSQQNVPIPNQVLNQLNHVTIENTDLINVQVNIGPLIDTKKHLILYVIVYVWIQIIMYLRGVIY